MKYFFFLFFFFALLPFASADSEVIIYKNGACGHCSIYLEEFKELLKEQGISWEEKDLLKDKNALLEVPRGTVLDFSNL